MYIISLKFFDTHTHRCVCVCVCVKKFQKSNIRVKNVRFLKIFNSCQYKLNTRIKY